MYTGRGEGVSILGQGRRCLDILFFFGRESVGLPEDLLLTYPERCVRIPMKDGLRSLNQSNSAAIAAYEYLRQKDFNGLCEDGGLV